MIYPVFFSLPLLLASLFSLTLLESAQKKLHKKASLKIFSLMGKWFLYRLLILKLFPKWSFDEILFSTIVTKKALRFAAIGALALFFYSIGAFSLPYGLIFLLFTGIFFSFFLFADYIPQILGSRFPVKTLWFGAIISTPFLFLLFPISYFFISFSHYFLKTARLDYLGEPMNGIKHEILEILEEASLSPKLNYHDKKLIESVIHFQTKIAREVMVPRMDMFCLSGEVKIKDAVKKLEDEGYSRVPVFKETIDNIIGVLMYKDILAKYAEYEKKGNDASILEAPIDSIVKKAMYTPESKKISNLLQDFKKKQVHLAIVVDEYGGTEGIVTIEDILEEIVGEIEDEYDDEDDDLFVSAGTNIWIIDGRMSLIDIKEQLGIELEESADYDTIGGFIFHKAGTIPSRGFAIKLDDANLEVMKSNDRRVEKVKIKKKDEGVE